MHVYDSVVMCDRELEIVDVGLCMYAFHLRPRGSNGTVAVRLIVVVWPVRSMHRAAVLVLLAGETSLSGSP